MVVDLHADRDIYVYKVVNVDPFAKFRQGCPKSPDHNRTLISQRIYASIEHVKSFPGANSLAFLSINSSGKETSSGRGLGI
jgi:hypothetical protein